MNEKNKTSISESSSIYEIGAFWDEHSPEDFPEQTYIVDTKFEFPVRSDAIVHIDPDLLEDIRRIAKKRKITTQTVINLWLQQRVSVELATV